MKIDRQVKSGKLFDLIGVTPMGGAKCLYSAPLKFSKIFSIMLLFFCFVFFDQEY